MKQETIKHVANNAGTNELTLGVGRFARAINEAEEFLERAEEAASDLDLNDGDIRALLQGELRKISPNYWQTIQTTVEHRGFQNLSRIFERRWDRMQPREVLIPKSTQFEPPIEEVRLGLTAFVGAIVRAEEFLETAEEWIEDLDVTDEEVEARLKGMLAPLHSPHWPTIKSVIQNRGFPKLNALLGQRVWE